MPALLDTIQPGKRLNTKAVVAQALLEQGETVRQTAKDTGISHSTAARMSRRIKGNDYRSPLREDHVDAVKKSIRDRFLLKASDALNGINNDKLEKASALELAKISSICLENAGLGPTSVVETHHSFFFQETKATPQPVDITPDIVSVGHATMRNDSVVESLSATGTLTVSDIPLELRVP